MTGTMMGIAMENEGGREWRWRTCAVRKRMDTKKRKDVVRIGCGAGAACDRLAMAKKLLETVPELDYLVLEFLGERTLALRYQAIKAGRKGFDPKVREWMKVLLPLAMKKGVVIISNIGAIDPIGAQEEVLEVAKELNLKTRVAAVYERATVSHAVDSKQAINSASDNQTAHAVATDGGSVDNNRM